MPKMKTARTCIWIVVIIVIAGVNAKGGRRGPKAGRFSGSSPKDWSGKTGNTLTKLQSTSHFTVGSILASYAIDTALKELPEEDYDKYGITCFYSTNENVTARSLRDARANNDNTNACKFTRIKPWSELFGSSKEWYCTLSPYNCNHGCRVTTTRRQNNQIFDVTCPEGLVYEFLGQARFKAETLGHCWSSFHREGAEYGKEGDKPFETIGKAKTACSMDFECGAVVRKSDEYFMCPRNKFSFDSQLGADHFTRYEKYYYEKIEGCRSDQCFCVSWGGKTCRDNEGNIYQCDPDECHDRTACPGNGYWCSDSPLPFTCPMNECWCVSAGGNTCGNEGDADMACTRDECYDRRNCTDQSHSPGYWCSDAYGANSGDGFVDETGPNCPDNQCWCVSNGGSSCDYGDGPTKCDQDECHDRTACPGNGYWCFDATNPVTTAAPTTTIAPTTTETCVFEDGYITEQALVGTLSSEQACALYVSRNRPGATGTSYYPSNRKCYAGSSTTAGVSTAGGRYCFFSRGTGCHPLSQVGGRCGPAFGGRCNLNLKTYARYCNVATGWCGDGSAHRDAQNGDEYDWNPTHC